MDESVEPYGLNLWFPLRGTLKAPAEITLVVLDDQGFEREGLSSFELWPRENHIRFIKQVARLGVKRVAYDLFFKELRNPQTDQLLAQAFAEVPTVLVSVLEYQTGSDRRQMLLKPHPMFAANAKRLAAANLVYPSGIVRNFSPEIDSSIPPLYIGAFQSGEIESLELPSERDFINYYGPRGSLNQVSLHDVIEGRVPESLITDKILFVGIALVKRVSKDSFKTPLSGFEVDSSMHGVEIHATQAANLLHKN